MRDRGSWLGILGTLALAGLPAPVDAQPVGSEFQINTYTTQIQGGGAVTGGAFVAVWASYRQDGSHYGVFGQRYDSDGVAQGDEFQVNTYTTESQTRPSVASDASGNFVVVWDSYAQDGSSHGVFGQRYDSLGAALGSEFLINSFTTGSQYGASVAADDAGNFVVVWESLGQDGSINGIFGQRYDSLGVAQGSEFQVNSYTTDDQRRPSMASDANGNFVVVWQGSGQYDGTGIFGQRYDGGGVALGAEFRVNSYGTFNQTSPSVASDMSGNFVAVWTSPQDDSGRGIFGQRYDNGGVALGGEFRVNSYTTSNQDSPSVASDTTGNFVVAWTSLYQDGSFRGIFGQRYDSAGVAQGSEFQVNSYTTYDQQLPSVAATSTNAFVVVWDAEGSQDGSSTGFFGQRFDFAPNDDFTLSCNPSALSIPPGSSGNSSCAVGSLDGFNGAVTLSCTGLPGGASCSYNPNPVTPPPDGNVNSTLTVSVANGTPLGSYPFQTQGVNGPLSHTFNMTLVTAPELIVNGGFEVSRAPWVFAGPGALYLGSGPLPHGGTGYAQFGGGNNRVGYAYQQVSIPNGSPANLTFWLNVTSLETSSTRRNDVLSVEVRNKSGVLLATLGTFSNLDKTTPGDYSQKAFSMAGFKGQTLRLTFRVATNASLPTHFRVDDVSLR